MVTALAQPMVNIQYEDAGVCDDSQEVKRRLEAFAEEYLRPISQQLARPELKFLRLKEEWENDTAHLSSITEISMHHAYQQIIGMGPGVIPYILRAMLHAPDHWFWALKSITTEDPVPPEDRGNMRKMTQAWLDWGHRQKHI